MLTIVHDYKTNYDYSNRNPNRICCVEGCGNPGQDITRNIDKQKGKVRRRKYCATHYYNDLVKRKGAKSMVEILAKNKGITATEYAKNIVKNSAARKGMTVAAYRRSNHQYRRHILNYCENIDGRLGFTCTTTIILDCGMLHADHKNGVPWDHRTSNMQTLCSCCHSYKSHVFKDYASAGRKSAKSLTEDEKKEIIENADRLYEQTFKKFTSNTILGIA